MRLFAKKEKKQNPIIGVFEAIEKERENWKNLINAHIEHTAYWKDLYEKEEKRKWELVTEKPFYEFIIGDKLTGWVWFEPIETYDGGISIGSKVRLIKSDTETVWCTVEKFNGITLPKGYNPVISFNVVECPSVG